MFLIFALVLVIGQCLGGENHPWIAQMRDKNWFAKHEHLLNQTHEHGKDAKIIFIGDSITEMWSNNGLEVWNKYYAPRHAYNYGISGDSTQHVLYRIANKELDGMSPIVAVLMIGTNNLKMNENQNFTVADIAHGIHEIVNQIKLKLPTTKILLLGILARPDKSHGGKAREVNALISKFEDKKTVFYLDMRPAFVRSDGELKMELYMKGGVHLLTPGYYVWQKTMEPLLDKLYPAL